MSCQKGNGSRSRPQKYRNQFAFKNNLHDSTPKTKMINSLEIANVCERCKSKLEWRIKYKKYKILSAPATCTKCLQRNVKHSYHIMCEGCAKTNECCPNCGTKAALIAPKNLSREEQQKFDQQVQQLLKNLPERKRRTFLRCAQKKDKEQGDVNNADVLEQLKKIVIEDDEDDEFDDTDDNLEDECSDEDSN